MEYEIAQYGTWYHMFRLRLVPNPVHDSCYQQVIQQRRFRSSKYAGLVMGRLSGPGRAGQRLLKM